MSIPIDKLYDYIEGIAEDIRGEDILIYRFYPHGSKNLKDLIHLRPVNYINQVCRVPIYCYDQEPLNYQLYNNNEYATTSNPLADLYTKYNVLAEYRNIATRPSIYDSTILLVSEQRSLNIDLYKAANYIPVYYWSHGLIARDWYRFAYYEKLNKSITKTFLIYNRAWSGTREYRLKFVDLLIDYNLISSSKITLNSIEPELGIHYSSYQFTNILWTPNNKLDEFVTKINDASSCASADYEIEDYNSTEFEVVLETLFDDDRLQLTEKILRPIALGQPFLLAATHGSLEYLRSYGFRTFATVIDESYDTIEDPALRLESIVKAMKEIVLWSDQERKEKLAIANQIAAYNRKHFFSAKFINQVTEELKINLQAGILELENTNTGKRYLTRVKELFKYPEIRDAIIKNSSITRQDLANVLKKARSYYRRILPRD